MHDISGPKTDSPINEATYVLSESRRQVQQIKTFRLEFNNVLSMYNTPQTDKLAVAKNWLGRKGLQYLETLDDHGKGNVQHLRKPI